MVKNVAERIFLETGAEALITNQEDFRFYLTGFKSSDGIVLVNEDGIHFYTDSRYIEAAERLLVPKGIIVGEIGRKETVSKLLNGYKKLAVSFSRMTASEYQELAIDGKFELVDSSNAFVRAMSVKGPEEIENIKLACKAADDAYCELLPLIKEGMTENEVAATLEYLMRMHGASGTSFETICAFGKHASVPHHETGMTKLKFADQILIDFGCKLNGYCSDCTRTILFGDDGEHEEFKDYYDKVLTAHMLVKEKFHSGMKGKEGDAIARDYLTSCGLGEYFTHSLGHSLGINVHEHPVLSTREETVFEDGMVFSDEPGVYFSGKLGIRIEDTVMLSGGSVQSLTNSDKKLTIL